MTLKHILKGCAIWSTQRCIHLQNRLWWISIVDGKIRGPSQRVGAQAWLKPAVQAPQKPHPAANYNQRNPQHLSCSRRHSCSLTPFIPTRGFLSAHQCKLKEVRSVLQEHPQRVNGLAKCASLKTATETMLSSTWNEGTMKCGAKMDTEWEQ